MTQTIVDPSVDPIMDRRQRVVSFIQSLPLVHRTVIAAAVVLTVLGLFFFFRWVSAPTWTTVASGIDAEQVDDAVAALSENAIPHRIEEAPTRIDVHQADRYRAGAILEEANIVSAGSMGQIVGNELLDNMGLSVTEALQEQNIRRALEGELARTLSAMEFIRSSRVSLVMPEEPLFADEVVPVEASVTLDLRTRPTAENIDAVVLTMAGAVEGLEPERVTVVDTDGKVWNSPNMRGGSAGEQAQNWTFKNQIENSLLARVHGTLADIGVASNAVLTADIEFDETSIESVTYDPATEVQIRRQLQEEDMTGVNGDPNGVPGVDGGDVEVGADGEFTYTNNIQNIESDFNRVQTITVQATGVVNGLSVGLFIDDGSLTGVAVPTPEQVSTVISAGLGLDVAAGDQLAIEAIPFSPPAEEETLALAAAAGGMDIFSLVAQAVGGLALILVILFLFLALRKPKDDDEDEVIDLAEEETRELAPPRKRPVPEIDVEAAEIRAEVVQMVQEKPEEIAGLLRAWMHEH